MHKTVFSKRKDTALLRAQLLDVLQVLDSHTVPYFLEGGTLLGIVRNGDILAHDTDTDLSINAEDFDRLKPALADLKARGWYVKTRPIKLQSSFAAASDLRVIKICDRFWGFMRGPHRLDIFLKYKDTSDQGTWRCWVAGRRLMRVSAAHYKSADLIPWRGHQLRAPKDYKTYLTEKYGDWSVVRKDWRCEDESTVYSE